MKGQAESWLPLPPAVLHLAAAIVNRSASPTKATTAWVFSSIRRVGRNPDNVDVAVNGSSLSHYLADLRKARQLDKRMPPAPRPIGDRQLAGQCAWHAAGGVVFGACARCSKARKRGRHRRDDQAVLPDVAAHGHQG